MSRLWTAAEVLILQENYAEHSTEYVAKLIGKDTRSVYGKANALGLKKSETYLASESSGRLTKSKVIGFNTQFKKGQTPFNKGKKQTEFMSIESIEKSKATRFKKGQVSHNTKELGIIEPRKDKSGKTYLYIKISNRNWILYQRYVWEQHNGPIPPNHIVRFKDKNTSNCEIENLELFTCAENMNLNTIHRYPTELKKSIKLVSKLNKLIIKKQNHGKK